VRGDVVPVAARHALRTDNCQAPSSYHAPGIERHGIERHNIQDQIAFYSIPGTPTMASQPRIVVLG